MRALLLFLTTTAHAYSDGQLIATADLAFCPTGTTINCTELNARTLEDDGSVWRVGCNRWGDPNQHWEQKFSKWIREEVGADFMIQHKLATDCVDAVLFLRTIFARIHHLPVAYDNSGILLSQDIKTYRKVPTLNVWNEKNWKYNLDHDLRFRKYLSLLGNTIGNNIEPSVYPIELTDPKSKHRPRLSPYFTEGRILYDIHHATFVSKVDPKSFSPIKQTYSSLPTEIRSLLTSDIQFTSDYVQGQGVLGFRWPFSCGRGFQLAPAERMPGYSLEQYGSAFKLSYDKTKTSSSKVRDYLKKIARDDGVIANEAYIDEKFSEIKALVEFRSQIVQTALKMKEETPDVFSDPSSDDYGNYSTSNRDRRLCKEADDLNYVTRHKSSLSTYFVKKYANEKIFVTPTNYIYFQDFIHDCSSMTANPNGDLQTRWGRILILPSETPHAQH